MNAPGPVEHSLLDLIADYERQQGQLRVLEAQLQELGDLIDRRDDQGVFTGDLLEQYQELQQRITNLERSES